MKFFYLVYAFLFFVNLQAQDITSPMMLNCRAVPQEKTKEKSQTDIAVKENSNKKFEKNNFFGANVGSTSGFDYRGNSKFYLQYGASFARQFVDNIWAELFYGYSQLQSFPVALAVSIQHSLSLRIKYTFALPFEFFAMPYVGARYIVLDTPDYSADLQYEMGRSIEDKAKRRRRLTDSLIFGATVVRRIIPGLLARADIGYDSINLGLNVEF